MQLAEEQIDQVKVAAVEEQVDEAQHGRGTHHFACQFSEPNHRLDDTHRDKVKTWESGDHWVPLVEFSTAVLLSLWDVKDLVHVWLPLLARDSGEQQAGYEEVDAAQSSEDVAFKFLHV